MQDSTVLDMMPAVVDRRPVLQQEQSAGSLPAHSGSMAEPGSDAAAWCDRSLRRAPSEPPPDLGDAAASLLQHQPPQMQYSTVLRSYPPPLPLSQADFSEGSFDESASSASVSAMLAEELVEAPRARAASRRVKLRELCPQKSGGLADGTLERARGAEGESALGSQGLLSPESPRGTHGMLAPASMLLARMLLAGGVIGAGEQGVRESGGGVGMRAATSAGTAASSSPTTSSCAAPTQRTSLDARVSANESMETTGESSGAGAVPVPVHACADAATQPGLIKLSRLLPPGLCTQPDRPGR
jgi:hypothetical protein